MDGFYRVGAAVPELRLGDVDHNIQKIQTLYEQAAAKGCAAVVFPELCVTGYTCADLFEQEFLISRGREALLHFCAQTRGCATVAILGLALPYQNGLYNCAAIIQDGKVLGLVPKSHIPNYREFYEKRWFLPGRQIRNSTYRLGTEDIPWGVDLLFYGDDRFTFGVELCEDLWTPVPPSVYQACAGAALCFNLSASDELVTKADYRRDLLRMHSARCFGGYVYASAGPGESSTDLVYGGHALIAENGLILAENQRFVFASSLITADVDVHRLWHLRRAESTLREASTPYPFRHVQLPMPPPALQTLERAVDPHPFVPDNPQLRNERCREIFDIQASALARRVAHCHARKLVIGVSGGLDSTLALLVCERAIKVLNRATADIMAVTMPGFGTTDQTYRNAVELAKALQTDFREMPIRESAKLQLQALQHDPNQHDVTYENVQARERTMLLMNLANKHGGLVVGTGDLSELALGWCTYNADHMSMYAVNASIPKTLVRYIISWVREQRPELQEVLDRILSTPISPELLPPDANGDI
ncbi:MAG: NAD(+) synthase, partial [Lentisphaerae bacterium]